MSKSNQFDTKIIQAQDFARGVSFEEKAEPVLIDLLGPAIKAIKEGEIVAFPTETVYGLGASAFQSQAIKKIYAAKGRPQDNPLIVHLADLNDLEKLARDIPDLAYKLFNEFAPGPLTLILKRQTIIPNEVTAGLDTVGIRFPNSLISRTLIQEAGPLVAPSANLSGKPSPTRAKHVYDDLYGKLPYIIDGGSSDIGLESTILDLTVYPPQILRPGGISKKLLEEFLDIELGNYSSKPDAPDLEAKAPGMKYRHYAPQAKLDTFTSAKDLENLFKIHNSDSLAVIVSEKTWQDCKPVNSDFLVLNTIPNQSEEVQLHEGKPLIITYSDLDQASHDLFAAFRFFDDLSIQYIYVQAAQDQGKGEAFMNRLNKAKSDK